MSQSATKSRLAVLGAILAGAIGLAGAQGPGATPTPESPTLSWSANSDSDVATAEDGEDSALSSARSLVQAGKFDPAEQSLHLYLDHHANSAAAHFLLGFTYFQEVHQKASPAEPGEFSTVAVSSPQQTAAKAKASLAEYTEGAKLRTPTAFDLKIVALDYVLLRDYVDADKWLTRSLHSNPKDAEGWYYLGRAKYNENRFEEALAAFQQYLKLDPRSVRGEDNLGLSYQGLGRTEEAVLAFKNAISWQRESLQQGNPGPSINLGALLLDENKPEQAISYLAQAAVIAPDYARTHEYLGKAYDRVGQLDKAQGELEKALALEPQSASLHYMLGQVYRKQGLGDKANGEFDRSAALRRESPSEGRQ